MVPAQGFEPWTIGLKVGPNDVRGVPPEAFKVDSVFETDRRLSAEFRRVSQKSVLVAAVIAAPLFWTSHLDDCELATSRTGGRPPDSGLLIPLHGLECHAFAQEGGVANEGCVFRIT